jgi:hypothetical protein
LRAALQTNRGIRASAVAIVWGSWLDTHPLKDGEGRFGPSLGNTEVDRAEDISPKRHFSIRQDRLYPLCFQRKLSNFGFREESKTTHRYEIFYHVQAPQSPGEVRVCLPVFSVTSQEPVREVIQTLQEA